MGAGNQIPWKSSHCSEFRAISSPWWWSVTGTAAGPCPLVVVAVAIPSLKLCFPSRVEECTLGVDGVKCQKVWAAGPLQSPEQPGGSELRSTSDLDRTVI